MKNMDYFDIIIMSVPHRDKLIAEISFKKYAVAEINIDEGIPRIQLFPYPNIGDLLELPLIEFQTVLEEAKKRLLNNE